MIDTVPSRRLTHAAVGELAERIRQLLVERFCLRLLNWPIPRRRNPKACGKVAVQAPAGG